jgi:hypothetical protein
VHVCPHRRHGLQVRTVIPSYVIRHCFEIKEREIGRGRGIMIWGANRMNG